MDQEPESAPESRTITSEITTNSTNPTPTKTKLLFDIRDDQCPIIYSNNYDIKFCGLQKLHPFDVTKWGRTHQMLLQSSLIRPDQSVEPKIAEREDLLRIHTERYLNSLNSGVTVAQISEVCPLVMVPSCLVRSKLLKPLRYQTGGSVLGTKLAQERNWAINLGGGFHHCSSDRGGGFCFYADISLCVKFLLDNPNITRIMICDLDAHQGNGHEKDFGGHKNVFILDAFNYQIYPHDTKAKALIRCPIPLLSHTKDAEYLRIIESHIKVSLENFPPHFFIYNAGTDIMENDPLGNLDITPKGIIQRDLLVFSNVLKRNIPILMLTSGGYQRETASVIHDSIQNLVRSSVISV